METQRIATPQGVLVSMKQVEKRLGLDKPHIDVIGDAPSRRLLRKAQTEALRSQLADLRTEIDQYEELRSRKRTALDMQSFDDLPRALIQARIAAGLSQKEFAARLGLKEQQIQRYEATDYASASLARVREVARALGLQVKAKAFVA